MDTICFRPDPLDVGGAFDRYREMYRVGSTVEPGPGAFHASVTAIRMPRLLLFERRLSGVSHARDRRRVARDGLDHITLQLILSGTMAVAVDGSIRHVGPGQIVLFDTTRPQRTWTAGVHSISAAVARDALAPSLRDAGFAHGLVLGSDEAGELIGYLRALGSRAPASGAALSDTAAPTLGALLGATLAALTEPTRANAALLSASRAYGRVLAYVDRHLGDPALSVSDIAACSGISRSALYRLFAPVDGVAAFVQQQRLRRLRLSLADADDDRALGALVSEAGFATTAHAARRFRRAFGMTPSEYRRNCGEAGPVDRLPPRSTRLPSLAPWLDELL
ncbi:helix-turn-helix domain-containing protein [Methylobacterium haplocladii]|uniref:AraC family transcriptional regulator n=1 Tax=Methylobacterium haplocladii TaxID=1176176 RepID=A0A512ILC2_9HYPH|nr:helix-turn-helix domain-containing protein [Methylobacterium haplocladii]GEO98428.1 AraC family transcriptional regulator [Methylobacterium haplocladii]GJD83056.1 hypothetical protein HPGCJGGD_0918 [Methylobacterium haplocladii]GLS61279.1 AraC family transcriptional regulator [Methylobacterium haplocladii]